MDMLASYSSGDSDTLSEHECKENENSSSKKQDYFNLYQTSDEDSDRGISTYEVLLEATILDEKCSGPNLPQIPAAKKIKPNQNFSPNNSVVVSNVIDTSSSYPSKRQNVRSNRIGTQGDTSDVFKPSDKQISSETCNAPLLNENFPIFRTDPAISYYITHSVPSKFPKYCKNVYQAHTSSVSAIGWNISQYSHLLLSASMDCTVKVWDTINHKEVQNILVSQNALKSAKWTSCGTKVICGGYGRKAHIFDISSGKDLIHFGTKSYISSIQILPESADVYLVGVKNEVLVFDVRKDPSFPIKCFSSKCGQILDMIFVNEGKELLCSSDIVSHDSADRTIMAWDFSSGALLSNQIFQERYTCPCLQLEPYGKNFVAQTNGNYIASFSTCRPYKMNKNKRYESHKVAGYGIGCDFSREGDFLASGDADGKLYIYWSGSAHVAKIIEVKHGTPTIQVKWHPVLCSTVAVATMDGEIQIWQ